MDSSSTADISLSIEETNKLRISLGLKPLDTGPSITKDQEAEQRYSEHKKKAAADAKASEIKEKIEKTKTRQKLREKLVGKGLGEQSDDEEGNEANKNDILDSRKWVARQRKKQKELELAAFREKELLEQEEQIVAQYTEDDLAGIRIGHSMRDFVDGEEKILILKDSNILDDEDAGDELTSVQLSEADRVRKNLENKRGKGKYTAYDDDEFSELGGGRKGILAQYDDEEKGGFVLGGKGSVAANNIPRGVANSRESDVEEKLKAQAISLTYNNVQKISDYYTPEEAAITFKKPNKKKRKVRKKAADEDDILDNNLTENNESRDANGTRATYLAPRTIASDASFVDDDDLQAALARSRRLKAKKMIKSSVEDVAKAVLASANSIEEEEEGEDESNRIILSDTTEFVRTLASAPTIPQSVPQPDQRNIKGKETVEKMEDVDMEEPEDGSRDVAMEDAEDEEGEIRDDGDNGSKKNTVEKVIEEEPLVSAGMAATVALLKQKGFVHTLKAEEADAIKVSSEKAKWLAAAKKREKELEHERKRDKEFEKEREKERLDEKRRGHGGGLDEWEREARDRERERQGEYRERQLARETQEQFSHYKPDINLDHFDDQGNKLNAKEAFRYLSHKFHGKHSGKMKTEKRMQKLEEKKKLEGMASNDTPLHLASALLERQKAGGTAHVVLTVGNRGAVPADVPLSAVSSISRRPNRGASTTLATNSTGGSASISTTVRSVPSAASTAVNTSIASSISRDRVAFGFGGSGGSGGSGGGGGKRKGENGEGEGENKRR